MTTLRRLAHHAPPLPAAVREWRLELLTGAALAAGLVGQLTGAY